MNVCRPRPTGKPERWGRLFLAEGPKLLREAPHPLGRATLDMLDVIAPGPYLFRVDQEDRLAPAHVVEQAGGGIDVERGADDDEDVAILHPADGGLDHGHRLAEPDDEGAQLLAMRILVAQVDDGILGREVVSRLLVAHGAGLHDLAVKMDHLVAARPLVQVVDVLRDDPHVEVLLQGRETVMALIRLGGEDLFPALVIKIEDKTRIGPESLGRGDILHPIMLPKTVRVPEGRDTAFGAHPGAGQHDKFLFHELFELAINIVKQNYDITDAKATAGGQMVNKKYI